MHHRYTTTRNHVSSWVVFMISCFYFIQLPTVIKAQPVVDKNANTIVLVTGASGYLAAHCVQQLLEAGYRVRGTVRSLKKETKVQPLREIVKKIGCPEDRLQLVEADLDQEAGWEEAVAGCRFVLHTASPFPIIADASIIETAVNGTLHLLKACSKCHSVKKVIVTSSCAAIDEGHDNPNRIFTEADWTDMEAKDVRIYSKSKTAAERAAWDFVHNLEEGANPFKLTCLNPHLIIGPTLIDMQGSSVLIIKRFITNDMPLLPPLNIALVDVRDVAKAHVLAMQRPETDFQRIILSAQPGLWFRDIGKILAKEFQSQGYKIPCSQAPCWFFKLYSLINAEARAICPLLNVQKHLDNRKAIQLLGIKFRDPAESLVEMVYSMIERGIVPKTKQYRGPCNEIK